MKKLLLSVFAVFFTAFSASAQIRNYVGVVRGKFSPELVSFLEKCRDDLKDHGMTTYAKNIDAYINGGFGSGFVYVTENGTNFVITNRHVVAQAVSASIEFEDSETGSTVKYDDLKIVATDDEIDIAILKFADGKNPFKNGLHFAAGKVTDGQEVFSAGFPGLGGDPLWQLGKGSVTNSSARIKELIDPSVSTLIQHSAEIDAGNSGGPLLVADSKESSGYSVVGVNTWKALARQNTNFSIPSSVVQNMISDYVKGTSVDAQKAVTERASKIAALLNVSDSDFSEMAKFISMRTAEKNGNASFEKSVKFAPTAVRNTILSAFASSPVEGFRHSVAYDLWKSYKVENNESAKFNFESVSKNGENYNVTYTQNEKKLVMTWIQENGLWRLESMKYDDEKKSAIENKSSSGSKNKKKVTSGVYTGFDAPTRLDISGGVLFGLGENRTGTGFLINVNNWFMDYVGLDVAFKNLPFGSKSLNSLYFGPAARLPYNFNDYFCLEGIAKLDAAISFGESAFSVGFKIEVGVETVFLTNATIKPGLGVSYSYAKFAELSSVNDEKTNLNDGFNSINIYAKVCF